MSITDSAPAPAGAPARHVVTLKGEERTLERPNGAKASRILAELRGMSGAANQISAAIGEFTRAYEASNFVELDPAEARYRNPPRPLLDTETGNVIVEPPELDGKPNPRAGEVVMLPSRVDTITAEEWQASGGKLRLRATPSQPELIAAVLPQALELAEDRLYRILALFVIPNGELKQARKAGTLEDLLDETVTEVIFDAYFDELLELAVVAGELVDHHLMRKARELGDRAGNALRLLGLGPKRPTQATTTETPSDSPATSTPSSSPDSPESSDGPPTPSSTPPTTSSPTSAASSRTPPPSNEPEPMPA